MNATTGLGLLLALNWINVTKFNRLCNQREQL